LPVPTEALTVSGPLTEHTKTADSGNAVVRQFCGVCGTHLFGKSDARPQFRVVRAGNLDNPSSIKPTTNIWADSAPVWACMDPAMERAAKTPAPAAASSK
jgi:hypothetical protein